MSSLALTALTGISSRALDAAFTLMTSQDGEATVQFGESHLDSMSEVSETESLRLQMAMDRLSKMVGTLSNLLHRIETTDAAITQSIK